MKLGSKCYSVPFQGVGRELLSRSDVFCGPCPAQWNSVHGFKTPKGQLVVSLADDRQREEVLLTNLLYSWVKTFCTCMPQI